MSMSHVTGPMSQMKSHDSHRKVVHRLCNSYISSVQEIHEDSIKFSLSSTDKGAVGFIPAQELAILTILRIEAIVKVFFNTSKAFCYSTPQFQVQSFLVKSESSFNILAKFSINL